MHAEHVARNLHDIAREVRVVALPDLPEKGDVSDWLERGGSAEALLAMCCAAPKWERQSTRDQRADNGADAEERGAERARIDQDISEINRSYALVIMGDKTVIMKQGTAMKSTSCSRALSSSGSQIGAFSAEQICTTRSVLA